MPTLLLMALLILIKSFRLLGMFALSIMTKTSASEVSGKE